MISFIPATTGRNSAPTTPGSPRKPRRPPATASRRAEAWAASMRMGRVMERASSSARPPAAAKVIPTTAQSVRRIRMEPSSAAWAICSPACPCSATSCSIGATSSRAVRSSSTVSSASALLRSCVRTASQTALSSTTKVLKAGSTLAQSAASALDISSSPNLAIPCMARARALSRARKVPAKPAFRPCTASDTARPVRSRVVAR
jgi:hypothetical protein